MKDAAFQELISSVREAGRIRRGTMKASRTTVFKPDDVKRVRASLGASQSEFALMIGVSLATLQNWEQGRRTPDGTALALLRVAPKIQKRLPKLFMAGSAAPLNAFNTQLRAFCRGSVRYLQTDALSCLRSA